jgi:hypothetical protein
VGAENRLRSKDDREAARFYKLAADEGNALAQVSLAEFYETGRGGLPKDNREGARLYKLAADQASLADVQPTLAFGHRGRLALAPSPCPTTYTLRFTFGTKARKRRGLSFVICRRTSSLAPAFFILGTKTVSVFA